MEFPSAEKLRQWSKMFRVVHSLDGARLETMLRATSREQYRDPDVLAAIPMEVHMLLFPQQIAEVWYLLPAYYRRTLELQGYLRCEKHHSDRVDGPVPMRKDCVGCMRGWKWV